MKKMQMLVVIASVLVLLVESAHRVQARPGPLAFYSAESQTVPRQLLSTDPVQSDTEDVSLSDKDAEELDSEEELDAVCIENGSCEERRVLADSVDYKHDGPNNPITDPPHN